MLFPISAMRLDFFGRRPRCEQKPVDSQASAPTQINVVLNWFKELKEKVPVGSYTAGDPSRSLPRVAP